MHRAWLAGTAALTWLAAGSATAQPPNEKPEPPPIFTDEPDDGGGADADQPPQDEQRCFPRCRPGFVCSPQGRCVSACNPPCGKGETCNAQQQCVPSSGSQAPAGGATQQPRSYGPPAQPPPPASGGSAYAGTNSAGWGRGAAIWGLVNIPLLLGGAAGVRRSDDASTAVGLGGALTLYGGIATAIVGAGAASPSGPDVRSMVGTLVPGWILYGISMFTGITLVALASAELNIAGKAAFVPAGLAAGANMFFAITGFVEAARAEAVQQPAPPAEGGRPYLAPLLLPQPGRGRPAVGLALGWSGGAL